MVLYSCAYYSVPVVTKESNVSSSNPNCSLDSLFRHYQPVCRDDIMINPSCATPDSCVLTQNLHLLTTCLARMSVAPWGCSCPHPLESCSHRKASAQVFLSRPFKGHHKWSCQRALAFVCGRFPHQNSWLCALPDFSSCSGRCLVAYKTRRTMLSPTLSAAGPQPKFCLCSESQMMR